MKRGGADVAVTIKVAVVDSIKGGGISGIGRSLMWKGVEEQWSSGGGDDRRPQTYRTKFTTKKKH